MNHSKEASSAILLILTMLIATMLCSCKKSNVTYIPPNIADIYVLQQDTTSIYKDKTIVITATVTLSNSQYYESKTFTPDGHWKFTNIANSSYKLTIKGLLRSGLHAGEYRYDTIQVNNISPIYSSTIVLQN